MSTFAQLNSELKKLQSQRKQRENQYALYRQIIDKCNKRMGPIKCSDWLPEGVKVSTIKKYPANFILKFAEKKTIDNKSKMGIQLVDPKSSKEHLNKFKKLFREFSKKYGCKIKLTDLHLIAG